MKSFTTLGATLGRGAEVVAAAATMSDAAETTIAKDRSETNEREDREEEGEEVVREDEHLE